MLRAYRFDLAAVVTAERLMAYCSRLPHTHGSKVEEAMPTLEWAAQNSASPMETIVSALLVLPYRHGGYGIDPPLMNVLLDPQSNIVPPDTPDCRKPDLARIVCGLAFECNGHESHSGLDDYECDSDRRDELEGMGIRVIPISAGKLYDVDRFHRHACEATQAKESTAIRCPTLYTCGLGSTSGSVREVRQWISAGFTSFSTWP